VLSRVTPIVAKVMPPRLPFAPRSPHHDAIGTPGEAPFEPKPRPPCSGGKRLGPRRVSPRFPPRPVDNTRMQLRHLRTFAAVASTLNITRAAEQIHLAQSSVTEQIQTLEADLGTPLFDRSRRGLQLTEAGRRLLDYAAALLTLASDARAAVADVAGLVAGTLTIGALETLCANFLPPMLARFRQRFPAIGLILKAAGSGELRNGVRNGALDLCFAFGAMPPDRALQSEAMAHDRLVLIMPSAHRLAEQEAISFADLTNEAFLVTETGCIYRRIFDEAFEAAGSPCPPIAGEFGSLAAILRMVEAGLGCALVPSLAIREHPPRINVRPWVGRSHSVPIVMIWRRRRILPPALRLLLDAARDGDVALKPAGVPPRHAAPSR
jgi:DNA-binding transcriptional LysR family regulator